MKTMKKALLFMLCAALVVSATVFGTLAYLTDTETVTNTFTVGKVGLSLDEAPVDANGDATEDTRVQENEYHLLPGHEYDKDPTVHVDADSEDSYIFVKVENGIAAIESKAADYVSVAQQIANNGWIALEGVKNVYYKEYAKSATVTDLIVFENFKIDGEKVVNVPAEEEDALPEGTYDLSDYEDATIVVTAYAIQKDGFADANAAWTAGNKTAAEGGWNP